MTPHVAIAITLATTLIIITFGYASACYVKPFGRCRKCNGTGRTTTRTLRRARWCRRCDATGLRLRIGRHVFNAIRRLYDDGTR